MQIYTCIIFNASPNMGKVFVFLNFHFLVFEIGAYHAISKRMKRIVESMRSFQKGDFGIKLEKTGIREFDELSVTFNIMVRRIEILLERTREEEAKSAEAERKALESQMNPHFLFNTLNTIKALAKMHGEKEIYLTTIRLGKLLRSSIDNRSGSATLRESIELVECYLLIQKLRFGDKLQYAIICSDELMDIETPKLILQPLVENAYVHGLKPKGSKGTIEIDVRKDGKTAEISVMDNGVGIAESGLEAIRKLFAGSEIGIKDDYAWKSIGLKNVYDRIKLIYGEDYDLRVDSCLGVGTVFTISIPLEGGEYDSSGDGG